LLKIEGNRWDQLHTSIEESVPQSGELGSDIATSRAAGNALDDLRSRHCDDSSSTSIGVLYWMIIDGFDTVDCKIDERAKLPGSHKLYISPSSSACGVGHWTGNRSTGSEDLSSQPASLCLLGRFATASGD